MRVKLGSFGGGKKYEVIELGEAVFQRGITSFDVESIVVYEKKNGKKGVFLGLVNHEKRIRTKYFTGEEDFKQALKALKASDKKGIKLLSLDFEKSGDVLLAVRDDSTYYERTEDGGKVKFKEPKATQSKDTEDILDNF